MRKILLATTLFFASAQAELPQTLYLMQTGNIHEAITLYQNHRQECGHHDFDLIEQIGIMLLEKGANSTDPEEQLLAIFGAGISVNEKTLYILEKGLENSHPQIQVAALNFLSQIDHDDANSAICRAINSDNLLLRLEAIYALAKKKHPSATQHAESLMYKVPERAHFLFPQIFAAAGDHNATKILRKMLSHENRDTRVATILSIAEYGRDDLLKKVRTLATHQDVSEQEACAVALGVLKDTQSIELLQRLAQSKKTAVRLAALQALYRLGTADVRTAIEQAAKSHDVFAIAVLGEMEGSESTLFELTKNDDVQVRINATLALLGRRDARCLHPLYEVLLRDPRDLGFLHMSSMSGALSAYKVIPSVHQNFQQNPVNHELSLKIRESALNNALNLPEKEFLSLANTVFDAQQRDLIPHLVQLLENLQTTNAIALLKHHQQKAGAPFVRNYCNLALYRLKENGPYEDNLRNWIAQQCTTDLVNFRPHIPLQERESDTPYTLTPEETSRLLIEALEAFAQRQTEEGIDVILEAIRSGNAKNRYALAGLLIRTTQ